MKIGNHACLFKDRINKETEELISGFATTGSAGFEVGARFFDIDRREYLNTLLEKNNISLSGVHVAIALTDIIDNKEIVHDVISKAREFILGTECRNIVLTGKKSKVTEDKIEEKLLDKNYLDKMAAELNEILEPITKNGISINYHNHAWEFENNQKIFKALLTNCPSLNFGLDLGWVAVAGSDPYEVIKACNGRTNYVHIRDYNLANSSFTEIGEGDVDFSKLIPFLKNNLGENSWAIIEYETGNEDLGRYRKAINYLNNF